MKKLLLTTCVAAMMLSCNQQKNENPLFSESTAPFGAPMFELIEPAHYMPAYVKGFEEHNEDIMCIINSTEAPTFENTIAALDRAGVLLDKVGSVFGNMTSAETNDDLIGIQRELSPLSTSHFDNIMLNDQLFERVKCVYDNQEKENLTEEQTNLLDKKYKQFISSGALLSAEDKEKLKEINKNLSLLYIKFSNNVLNETNEHHQSRQNNRCNQPKERSEDFFHRLFSPRPRWCGVTSSLGRWKIGRASCRERVCQYV